MTHSRQLSPYEMFTAISPRLLNRPADMGAVSLLGQAVSDVLDEGCPESDVLQLIADLESARSSAATATINERWELPLTGLVALLRQNLHNRTVQAAAVDPSSSTLRDKVLAAIDAGVDTPTAIGEYVHSPTTVVSRVLRQLADEGRVERAERGEDRRRRPYRLVDATGEPAAAAEVAPEGSGDERWPPSRLVDPTAEVAAGEEAAPASPARGLTDVAALVDFAEAQTQSNARNAAALLPDLIAAGSNARLDPALRVGALSAAGVITRASVSSTAREDAVDLAETTDLIAKLTDENLVRARGAYELARAGLFAFPDQPRTYLPDLQRAEEFAERETGAPAKIRLGWCAYTRCLIDGSTDLVRATQYAGRALDLFREAPLSYGEAAALTILARVRYTTGAWEGADELALKALSIANSHGYLRIMAESSFWAAELLSEKDPDYAEHLFANAAEHFEAVGSLQWRALSYASRAIARVHCRDRELRPDEAEELLRELLDLQEKTPSNEKSWAAAVLTRWIAACSRRAHHYDVAEREFDASRRLYEATASTAGLAMAQAGLLASEREHPVVREEDVKDALHGAGSPFGSSVPQAAQDAIGFLDDQSCNELAPI